MRFHLEENESRNSEHEEVELEDENSSDSKVVRAIKKKTSSIRKVQKVAKQKVLMKLQIIIAIGIVVLVVMWGKAEDFLHWASGLEEVTITEKAVESGCHKITTSIGETYCIDPDSYNLAVEGYNYLIEETQYSFKLRTVQ